MSSSQGMDTKLMCEIPAELKKKVQALRFSKSQTFEAIIIKIDQKGDNNTIRVDEEFDDISPDDLSEELPERSPRFVIYSYMFTHKDGRKTYPLMFINYSPAGCNPVISMMYAGTKIPLVKELKMDKVYDIRDREDLTEDWLNNLLG